MTEASEEQVAALRQKVVTLGFLIWLLRGVAFVTFMTALARDASWSRVALLFIPGLSAADIPWRSFARSSATDCDGI